MKTPITERMNWQSFKFLMVFFSLLLIFNACSDDKYERKEYLIVSQSEEKEAVSRVYCKITNDKDTLFVFANVEYDLFFETGDEDAEWLKVVSKDYMPGIEATRIIVEYTDKGKDMKMRTGVLSFSSKEVYLGQFVLFTQGFTAKFEENFVWLKYGTNNPLDTSRETLIKSWTEVQQKIGWTAASFAQGIDTLCYGKNGYVKLGNELNGVSLTTPYITDIVKDTIVALQFDAVAFVSDQGDKDSNKLTVNVVGGGEFKDGTTSTVFDLGYYDHLDRHVAVNMWKDVQHRLFVVSRADNKITGNTRFQFVTGVTGETGAANRTFIDNVSVFSVSKDSYYLVESK